MNIYQEIWNCDMRNTGVKPLIKGISEDKKDKTKGFVVVDLDPEPQKVKGTDKVEIKVFKGNYIPEIESNKNPNGYELFKTILDNYNANPPVSDEDTIKAIDNLLNYVIDTEVMKITKQYLDKRAGESCTKEDWWKILENIWFKNFNNKTDCSGFENIFIGEQGAGKNLGGHHFWYHYVINDGPFDRYSIGDIVYSLKDIEVQRAEDSNLAEVIKINYKYDSKDCENPNDLELNKNFGAFFVGTSVEGLMAIITTAVIDTVINGVEDMNPVLNNKTYGLKTIIFSDSKPDTDNLLEHLKTVHLKTCYPIIQE